MALFGRRGTYLIKTFSTIALVLSGVTGSDEANILLVYAFLTFLYQRDLEAPMQNEVDGVGEIRVYVTVLTVLIVIMTLLPLPY